MDAAEGRRWHPISLLHLSRKKIADSRRVDLPELSQNILSPPCGTAQSHTVYMHEALVESASQERARHADYNMTLHSCGGFFSAGASMIVILHTPTYKHIVRGYGHPLAPPPPSPARLPVTKLLTWSRLALSHCYGIHSYRLWRHYLCVPQGYIPLPFWGHIILLGIRVRFVCSVQCSSNRVHIMYLTLLSDFPTCRQKTSRYVWPRLDKQKQLGHAVHPTS